MVKVTKLDLGIFGEKGSLRMHTKEHRLNDSEVCVYF